MNITQLKNNSAVTKSLWAVTGKLPDHFHQAWEESIYHVARYISDRKLQAKGYSDDDTKPGFNLKKSQVEVSNENMAMLACARLDWLLSEVRPQLSGLFSVSDIMTMMNSNLERIHSPQYAARIASNICDDLGIDLDAELPDELEKLVNILCKLEAAQSIALADALEQAWYRSEDTKNLSIREFFATLDIELR